MSANEGLYQELRHAHQSALCNARLRAAELNFDAPDAPCLDWFRFRVATGHFFPELMPGENRELYLENLAWRDLKKFEFSRTDDLEAAGLLTLQSGQTHPGPAIYCTFHMGGWAVQPVLLLHRNIPLTIVAGPHVSEGQGTQWVQMNSVCLAQERWQADLAVINTDGQSALIQMMRQLRQGRSLYICLDGHRSVRGESAHLAHDRHGLTVRLNGRDLRVRPGAAYLAHQLGVPLVPMMSWRDTDGRANVEIGEAIHPEGDREAFAQQTLQQLWSRFESLARVHGAQWEMGWHSYRSRPVAQPASGFELQRHYRFNAERYHLYQPAQGLLLDAKTDELKRVPASYAKWLGQLRQRTAAIPGQWLAEQIKDAHSLQQIVASELLVAQ